MRQPTIAKNMLNNMFKHNAKIISAFILTTILFAFLHSEAGLFDFDDNNHGSHDYCEIVKNVTTKSLKDSSNNLSKLHVDESKSFLSIELINQDTESFKILDLEQFYPHRKATEVYLFNSSFLI